MYVFCVEAGDQLSIRLKINVQFFNQLAQRITQAFEQGWFVLSNAAQINLRLGFFYLLEDSNHAVNIDIGAFGDTTNLRSDRLDRSFGMVDCLMFPIILKVIAIKFGQSALICR